MIDAEFFYCLQEYRQNRWYGMVMKTSVPVFASAAKQSSPDTDGGLRLPRCARNDGLGAAFILRIYKPLIKTA